MKNYIVLFREPDGRKDAHAAEEVVRHRENWKRWMEEWGQRITGGSGLTLEGRVLSASGEVLMDVHRVGEEIVGGFLLLKAGSLDEAAGIVQCCPIFEFGGYAEVRELQG